MSTDTAAPPTHRPAPAADRPAPAARRRAALTWTGLLTVPLLVAGLLAWAFGHGVVNQGSAVAAVVNDDQPVTINGQLVPLGRQLAQKLVHGADQRYQWVLTNDDDAAKGLANGDYAAVVTIPPAFSELTTSSATTKEPLTAGRGVITVATSRDAALADALISKDVADAATAAMAEQVVQTYLDNVYLGFTTIHGKIGEAADGATQLAGGTGKAKNGSQQLADGTGTLVVGLGTLASGAKQADTGARALVAGAAQLRTGTGQLAAGASALAKGTGQLSDGADQLADGLGTIKTQTAQLPTQTKQLADGARQVADGNAQLADQVVPIANKVIMGLDAIPNLSDNTAQLQALVKECPNWPSSATTSSGQTVTAPADFCDRLTRAVSVLAGEAGTLDGKKNSVRNQVVDLRDGVIKLKDGSAQVADGNEQLAAAAPALTNGIAQASDGANQLATGAKTVDSGAKKLASGSKQVSAGTNTLYAGVKKLAAGIHAIFSGAGDAQDGARQLEDGADQLADGLTKVDQGASQLATGLDSSRGAVPSYTDAERDHLKQTAASPAYVQDASGDVLGRITGSFFVVLALWIGAMATYLVTRALPRGVLASRESTSGLVTRAMLPGALVAAASGLILAVSLSAYLELGVRRMVLVTLAAVVVGLAFAALNQGLAAALGGRGHLVALAVLVVTSAVGVLATTPRTVKDLEAMLPTHDAMVAVRAAATGGTGLVPALLQLGVWVLVGVVATAFMTDRRRSVSRRFLRPKALF